MFKYEIYLNTATYWKSNLSFSVCVSESSRQTQQLYRTSDSQSCKRLSDNLAQFPILGRNPL